MPLRLLLLFCLILPAGCADEAEAPPERPAGEAIPFDREGTLAFVRGGDTLTTIAIEIAETDSARTRGLMERTSLPEQSGMLFIFQQEEQQRFWMANTPLALDLFFADADSQIVRVARYARPFSPDPIFSEAPAQFVVEVPAGFADRYGTVEGDRITWQRE